MEDLDPIRLPREESGRVVPIALPALRERLCDLPALVSLFLERYARRYGRPVPDVDPGVLELLAGHAWPGNIRELEHLVQRMVVLKAPGEPLGVGDLPPELRRPRPIGAGAARGFSASRPPAAPARRARAWRR